MYAIRCNSGHPNGFRVGATVYSNQVWKLEESLTAEHEFAFEHGALAIVQVNSAADPALLPYPVEQGQMTLEPERTVGDLAAQLATQQGQVASQQAQIASQQALIEGHIAQITTLSLHIEAIESDRSAQAGQITTLKAQLASMEHQLAEVAATVATFPAESATDEHGVVPAVSAPTAPTGGREDSPRSTETSVQSSAT